MREAIVQAEFLILRMIAFQVNFFQFLLSASSTCRYAAPGMTKALLELANNARSTLIHKYSHRFRDFSAIELNRPNLPLPKYSYLT